MKTIITFAVLLGIFGNGLFLLGVLGFFYPTVILLSTFLYWSASFYIHRRHFTFPVQLSKLSVFEKSLVVIFLGEVCINLVGVLGPELGFDALWYHLTLPKLFLLDHTIHHIPGGLLYYSDMPKLTELFYSVPLSVQSETGAKLIHFLFGIGVCVTLYLFSRKYLSRSFALLSVLVFYSNLVVGWESITAYIDLTRTFFEFLAFILVVRWYEKGNNSDFYLSGVMLGLAVSTKLLVFASLPIYLVILLYIFFKKKTGVFIAAKQILFYAVVVLIIPLPWFVTSFLSTGKPFYPFFTDVSQGSFNPLSLMQFIRDVFILFVKAPDPISPLYIIFLPILVIAVLEKNPLVRLTSIYSLLAIIIWYFLPRIGGGRFILPYLPVFSFLAVYAVHSLHQNKGYRQIERISVGLIVVYAFIFIVYRGVANAKFLPSIVGEEPKAHFLTKHLNFSYGDFYDTDGYLKKTIKKYDNVLLYGLHNLYYVDFPFVDTSYIKKGDTFNYILTQNTPLPERFTNWNLIYSNPVTHVMLYGNGGMKWEY